MMCNCESNETVKNAINPDTILPCPRCGNDTNFSTVGVPHDLAGRMYYLICMDCGLSGMDTQFIDLVRKRWNEYIDWYQEEQKRKDAKMCNCMEDQEDIFTSTLEFRLERIEQMLRPMWKSPRVYPMPIAQPVLVYLKDGEMAIATRLETCTVIGHNVPIEDMIRLWIELPALPVGLDKAT